MNKEIFMIILKTIILIVLLTLFFYILNASKANKNIKRINRFSLTSLNNEDPTFFDKLEAFFQKLIMKISTKLSKINIFQRYAKHYEKYDNNGYKYIILKFFLALIFILLNFLCISIYNFKQNVISYLISFMVGFELLDLVLKLKYYKKEKKAKQDLIEAIIIMNNALKSHLSINQAINIVINELNDPIKEEFKKISIDLSYGISIDEAFKRFYERTNIEEIKYIVVALKVMDPAKKNYIKIIDLIEKKFLYQKKIKNLSYCKTISSVLIFRISLLIPFLIPTIILIINKKYFQLLYTTYIGIIILIIIILLYILYIFLIRKILRENEL